MVAWTPGEEELAIILAFAREAELNTALIERIVPGARSGDRKRKVAHVIAACEASLDAIAEEVRKGGSKEAPHDEAPDPATNPGAHNRKVIAEAVEAAAASGEPNI